MKTIMLLIAVSAMAVACSDSSSPAERTKGYSQTPMTTEDSLFQQVMNGHDAAMAKMGKLVGLRKRLAHRIDSLSKPGSRANKIARANLQDLADRLQASEAAMNAWMEAFSIDSAKNDREKRMAYLQSEVRKVDTVKDHLLANVAEADSILNK